MSKIDLWTQRGISYEEVRNRITERPLEDCYAANIISNVSGTSAGLQLAELADRYRSTEEILKIKEPKMRRAIGNNPKIEQYLEIHALTIEAYVRTAQKHVPNRTNGSN